LDELSLALAKTAKKGGNAQKKGVYNLGGSLSMLLSTQGRKGKTQIGALKVGRAAAA